MTSPLLSPKDGMRIVAGAADGSLTIWRLSQTLNRDRNQDRDGRAPGHVKQKSRYPHHMARLSPLPQGEKAACGTFRLPDAGSLFPERHAGRHVPHILACVGAAIVSGVKCGPGESYAGGVFAAQFGWKDQVLRRGSTGDAHGLLMLGNRIDTSNY